MVKNIVTARLNTDNSQIFIKCNDTVDALRVAGQLHRIELKEHTYSQIRLRNSVPSMKQGYKWISLVKWVYNNGA